MSSDLVFASLAYRSNLERLPEYTKLEYIKASIDYLIFLTEDLCVYLGNRLYTYEDFGGSGHIDTTGGTHGSPL